MPRRRAGTDAIRDPPRVSEAHRARRGRNLDRPPRSAEVAGRKQPKAGTPPGVGQPVVRNVHHAVVRTRRVAVDGDIRESSDPRRRAPLDLEPRPTRPLVVAPGGAGQMSARRSRHGHVGPVEARSAISRPRTPGDRHVVVGETAGTRPGPRGRHFPCGAAVVRNRHDGVEVAPSADPAIALVCDCDATWIAGMRGDDGLECIVASAGDAADFGLA